VEFTLALEFTFSSQLQEYDTITSAIDTIISCVSQVDNKNGED